MWHQPAEPMPPRVAIVILNWNGWADTLECLQSLYRATYKSFVAVVVDNGSIDGSPERIRLFAEGGAPSYDSPSSPSSFVELRREEAVTGARARSLPDGSFVLLRNERNFGFAEGNNIAIRYVLGSLDPEYILLLNNDTVVDPRFLDELVAAAQTLPEAAVLGPVMYYYSDRDRINFSGEDVVVWKGDGVRYTDPIIEPREVNKIDGACMLFSTPVLREVGLLYPGFFAYWEETDLCYRAFRAGHRLYCVPASRIWHKISASTGGVTEANYFRIFFLTRNRFLFVKRNGTTKERALFLGYFFYWDMWRYVRHYVAGRNIGGLLAFLCGAKYGVEAFRGSSSDQARHHWQSA
jgi:GT2 family glycosyltransferase